MRGIFKDLSSRMAFKPNACDSRLGVFVERMVAVNPVLLRSPRVREATPMQANKVDKIFDEEEVDVNAYLDLSKPFRPQ